MGSGRRLKSFRFQVGDESSPRIRESGLHEDGRKEMLKSQISFMKQMSGRSKTALDLKPHCLRFTVAIPGHSGPFPFVARVGNCDGNAMYSYGSSGTFGNPLRRA